MNGLKVLDSSNLKNIISAGYPNDKTKITIVRNGKEKILLVTL